MDSHPVLSSTDIDSRKQFLEDLKTLSKAEYEEVFRIIHRHPVEFTENSNGVFFDLMLLSNEVFAKLTTYMVLCQEQRKNDDLRTKELGVLRQEIQ